MFKTFLSTRFFGLVAGIVSAWWAIGNHYITEKWFVYLILGSLLIHGGSKMVSAVAGIWSKDGKAN